jgi:hypothetical protein
MFSSLFSGRLNTKCFTRYIFQWSLCTFMSFKTIYFCLVLMTLPVPLFIACVGYPRYYIWCLVFALFLTGMKILNDDENLKVFFVLLANNYLGCDSFFFFLNFCSSLSYKQK